MRTAILHAVAAALCSSVCGCLSARTEAGYEQVLRDSHALAAPARASTSADAQQRANAEAELRTETRLATVLRVALDRNPELHEAAERVRASAARVPAAGRLPDPELKYEQWAVPLDRPYALDKAGMLMLGVRQSFPAAGSLDAQSRVALHEAQMTLQAQRSRVRDLRAAAERAYFEYARTESEQGIRAEHEQLAARILEFARTSFANGRGSLQDVLRLEVELARLHGELIELEAQRRSARAMLNTLMARPTNAPLGPPVMPFPVDVDLRGPQLEASMLKQRPEVAAAERAIERSNAMLGAAKQTARWPSFMVGLDYWLMPQATNPHAYGAMVSMSLPWLNPQHDEQVREAEHTLQADRNALQAVRNASRYELEDALARYQAARESFVLVDRELIARAERSYEAAQAAFASGQSDALGVLDALHTYLDVRLERNKALARLQTALADVERSAGTALMPAESNEGTVHHD
jgi:cobalt-zinc-cadmium efflux system outer membrane protein